MSAFFFFFDVQGFYLQKTLYRDRFDYICTHLRELAVRYVTLGSLSSPTYLVNGHGGSSSLMISQYMAIAIAPKYTGALKFKTLFISYFNI